MNALGKFEEATCAIALALSVVITFANVIARYFFRSGFHWADETVRYLIIYVTFVGLGMAIRRKAVIFIDLLQNIVGEKANSYLSKMIHCVELFFALVITYLSSKLLLTSWRLGEHTLATDIPIVIPYFPLFLGGVILFMRALEALILEIKGVRS
jgi:C4-dicarboxylate transporter DctQ subunit